MKRKILKVLVTSMDWFLNWFGYEVELNVKRLPVRDDSRELLNLNIGAGDYVLKNFKSLDFYSEHYYGAKAKFLKHRIEYDIRKDDIPYENNTVDNIYISHVIEHVETIYVEKLLTECFRVLKNGSILRIACPDGKFLFNVSQFANGYWSWRHKTFLDGPYTFNDLADLKPFDFLMRELSTQKCRVYDEGVKNSVLEENSIERFSYRELRKLAVENVTFRPQFPGDHINVWDFEQLRSAGLKAGFSHVVESKQHGSLSPVMQGCKFDKKAPQMSLYVDFVK